jgi:copper(I)-binding protein
MQMTPVERITIAAHIRARLRGRNGLSHDAHGADQAAQAHADHVPITLQFADGSSLLVQFDVRKPDAT